MMVTGFASSIRSTGSWTKPKTPGAPPWPCNHRAGRLFALLTLDEDCPAPSDLVDECFQAMREEYPGLDASPALETIDGHHAVGHDLEFLALDIANSSTIRCFQTARRTVFVFGQWSDLDGEEPETFLTTMRGSIEETDAA